MVFFSFVLASVVVRDLIHIRRISFDAIFLLRLGVHRLRLGVHRFDAFRERTGAPGTVAIEHHHLVDIVVVARIFPRSLYRRFQFALLHPHS